MELEGFDYEELIDKWGLRKKYKKQYKAIWNLNELALISDDDMCEMHEGLGVRILTEYIGNAVTHDDDGNTMIDPLVHEDMLDFLEKLYSHSVCSAGDAMMYHSIISLSQQKETMFEFYRWFVHCLPLMWN